jgi:hypothetical protein
MISIITARNTKTQTSLLLFSAEIFLIRYVLPLSALPYE